MVAVTAGVVACQAQQEQKSAGTSSSAAGTTTVAPATTPPPPPPPPTWPLTGVQAQSVPADRPALAVKIENSIDARPQTGLNSADIVWEEVVEGGITRYMAVFHSTLPPEIGPVRSIRPMDASIAGPLRGVLAFSGGVRTYITNAANAGVQVLSQDSGSAGFYRVKTRRAPHNVYADPAALLGQADAGHHAAPPPVFTFPASGQQPTAVAAGAPAGILKITMSGVSHPTWTWSAPDGRWLRSENATPATQSDGARLSATNVVVLRVNVVTTSARDPAGNPVPETVFTGQGAATVATGGKTVAATWRKGGPGEGVVLTGADGAGMTLAPGNTWVELVPNGSGNVTTG